MKFFNLYAIGAILAAGSPVIARPAPIPHDGPHDSSLIPVTITTTMYIAPTATASPTAAPVLSSDAGHDEAHGGEGEDDDDAIVGNFIGIWDPEHPLTPTELFQKAVEVGVDADKMYIFNNSAFSGFSGPMNNHCIRAMSTFDGLAQFEAAVEVQSFDVQINAPWGLQRLSQGNELERRPTDPSLLANNDFRYSFDGNINNLGKDVDIYIVDTGINTEHVDFGGRAKWGFTVDTETDDQGHGTHVAGTAAGTVWGVAKNANIIAVKVLGERGTTDDIIKGLDFVVKSHDERLRTSQGFAGSIASMSLGSASVSPSIDRVVAAANKRGIHFSVASGNENQDACRSSPSAASAVSNVISVGSININDQRSSFSNFGSCTQVYAPGQDITSTWIGGVKKVNTISGTSMACPHITGLMAYFLGQDSSLRTDTAALKARILDGALTIQTDVGAVKVANNGFRT